MSQKQPNAWGPKPVQNQQSKGGWSQAVSNGLPTAKKQSDNVKSTTDGPVASRQSSSSQSTVKSDQSTKSVPNRINSKRGSFSSSDKKQQLSFGTASQVLKGKDQPSNSSTNDVGTNNSSSSNLSNSGNSSSTKMSWASIAQKNKSESNINKPAQPPQQIQQNLSIGTLPKTSIKFGNFEQDDLKDIAEPVKVEQNKNDSEGLNADKSQSEQVQVKTPVAVAPGFKQDSSQFQEIQRIRSAPPELSEQELILKNQSNGNDSKGASIDQNQKHDHQTSRPPQFVPQSNGQKMDPHMQNFMPQFMPGYPPMYMMDPNAVAAQGFFPNPYQGFPPFGFPPPTNMPRMGPSVNQTPAKSGQQSSFVSKNNSTLSSKQGSTSDLVKPPTKPKIQLKLVDPKTGEEIKLPEKKSKSTLNSRKSSVSNLQADNKQSDEIKQVDIKSEDQKEDVIQVQKSDPQDSQNSVKDEITQSGVKSSGPDLPVAQSGDMSKFKVEIKPQANEISNQTSTDSNKKAEIISEEKVKSEEPLKSEKAEIQQESEDNVQQDQPEDVKQSTEKSPGAISVEDGEVEESLEDHGHVVTSDGKRIYTIDFLLSFRDKCTQKPADLPSMEAILGEESSLSRRGSKKVERGSFDFSRPQRHTDILPSRASRASLSRSSSGTKPPPGLPPGLNVKQPPGLSKKISSSSSFGSSFGGRGSRGFDRKPQLDINVLKRTENRWMPSAFGGDAQLEENEKLKRLARSLLNKLTVEKFVSVSDKMLALPIQNPDNLQDLIEMIFDKATDEWKFAEMYSQLCLKLWRKLPEFPESYKDRLKAEDPEFDQSNLEMATMFRKLLLTKCQAEFEKRSEWANAEPLNISDDMSKEELAKVAAEENDRRKLKRRTLGNVRFFGELYKCGMLSEKIIWSCLIAMLKDVEKPEEEEVECVADLLSTVGERMDTKKAVSYMKEVFDRLAILSKHQGLQSRVRFKVLDVIELRQRKWQKRADANMNQVGPMKLDEARKITDKSQRQTTILPSRPTREIQQRSNNDRKPTREPPRQFSNGWNTVSAQQKSGWNPPDKSQAADNKSRATSNALSRSSSQESIESNVGSSSNIFDALNDATQDMDDEPQHISDHEDQEIEKYSQEVTSPTEPISQEQTPLQSENASPNGSQELASPSQSIQDLPKDLLAEDKLEKWIHKELRNEFSLASEESLESSLRIILKIRSQVEDQNMESITARVFNYLIENMSNESSKVEESQASRNRLEFIGYSVSLLINSGLLNSEAIINSVQNQVVGLADNIFDFPGLSGTLGIVNSVLVLENVLSLQQIKGFVKEAADMYDFAPNYSNPKIKPPVPEHAIMWAYLLDSVQKIKDQQFLKDLITKFLEKDEWSMVKIRDLVSPFWGLNEERLNSIPDDVLQEWLKKNHLEQLFQ